LALAPHLWPANHSKWVLYTPQSFTESPVPSAVLRPVNSEFDLNPTRPTSMLTRPIKETCQNESCMPTYTHMNHPPLLPMTSSLFRSEPSDNFHHHDASFSSQPRSSETLEHARTPKTCHVPGKFENVKQSTAGKNNHQTRSRSPQTNSTPDDQSVDPVHEDGNPVLKPSSVSGS